MKIVASQNVPGGETRQSAPEFVDWQWHYNVPSLSLWAIGITLLIWAAVRRESEGWRLVVPAILGFLLWQLEGFGILVAALAAVWVCVYVKNRNRALSPQRG